MSGLNPKVQETIGLVLEDKPKLKISADAIMRYFPSSSFIGQTIIGESSPFSFMEFASSFSLNSLYILNG